MKNVENLTHGAKSRKKRKPNNGYDITVASISNRGIY